MFDIGWMELLLIGIVALIVVGPKDLPKLFRAVGHFMGKARGMAREFQRSMEQAADESGLKDATRELNAVNKLNLNSASGSARKYAEGLVAGKGKGRASGTAGGPSTPGGGAKAPMDHQEPPASSGRAEPAPTGQADPAPAPQGSGGAESQTRS